LVWRVHVAFVDRGQIQQAIIPAASLRGKNPPTSQPRCRALEQARERGPCAPRAGRAEDRRHRAPRGRTRRGRRSRRDVGAGCARKTRSHRQIDFRSGGDNAADRRRNTAELVSLAPDVILAIGSISVEQEKSASADGSTGLSASPSPRRAITSSASWRTWDRRILVTDQAAVVWVILSIRPSVRGCPRPHVDVSGVQKRLRDLAAGGERRSPTLVASPLILQDCCVLVLRIEVLSTSSHDPGYERARAAFGPAQLALTGAEPLVNLGSLASQSSATIC
jgi:hypothetical protein